MAWPKWIPNSKGPLKPRVRYVLANWKLGVHLTFRTKHFGVNNGWWFRYESIMGWPLWKQVLAVVTIKGLIGNLKGIHRRARTVHILDDGSFTLLYGRSKYDEVYRSDE